MLRNSYMPKGEMIVHLQWCLDSISLAVDASDSHLSAVLQQLLPLGPFGFLLQEVVSRWEEILHLLSRAPSCLLLSAPNIQVISKKINCHSLNFQLPTVKCWQVGNSPKSLHILTWSYFSTYRGQLGVPGTSLKIPKALASWKLSKISSDLDMALFFNFPGSPGTSGTFLGNFPKC